MSQYIGITVGPIAKTLSLTSTPAGLWAASYAFSLLSRTICELLTDAESGIIAEDDILVPFFDRRHILQKKSSGMEYKLLETKDGIGLFHDRIIFRKPESFSWDSFNELLKNAKDLVAGKFALGKEDHNEYFRQYLRVAAVEFEPETDKDNPVLCSSKYLDPLELEAPFVQKIEWNPILTLFDARNADAIGATEAAEAAGAVSRNKNIKESGLTADLNQWILYADAGNKKIRTLADISSQGIDGRACLKKHSYFVLVHADGDRMGDLLKRLAAEEVRAFSKTCLTFASEAAEEIRIFGGVPIFAGGDDLLYLSPVENKSGVSFLSLAKTLGELFDRHFESFNPKPSISFGMQACFYKFPLYEALRLSQDLLFQDAKSSRNSIAVSLLKHSGKREGFLVDKSKPVGLDMLCEMVKKAASSDDRDFLRSAERKIIKLRALFVKALDQDQAQDRDHDLAQMQYRDQALAHDRDPAQDRVPAQSALSALFGNLFNEDIHKQTGNAGFLKSIENLMRSVRSGDYRIHCIPGSERQSESRSENNSESRSDSNNKSAGKCNNVSASENNSESRSDSNNKSASDSNNKSASDNAIDATISILSLLQFFTETAGEEERSAARG